MSMARKLFYPIPGQLPARYCAFRLNGTLAYRGDVALIDTTAPTSQGTSGVVAGRTMGTNDYFYVVSNVTAIANDATVTQGLGVGFIEGLKIGDRNTTTALPDDGVIIVQVAGVMQDHAAVSSAATLGDILLYDANATLGAARRATGIPAASANTMEPLFFLGVALKAGATYTRAAVTNANGCTAWIKCGDVI